MKINELDKNAGVTQSQLDALENVLDRVFGNVGIDVEFTRHFLDRVNDARNVKPISIKELAMLFKKEFVKYGKPIAQLGPDAEAVMKDLSSDINIPFALNWNGEELELIAKTVMRKKNFSTPNKEFSVESNEKNAITEDLGSMPPLVDLIVLAVVAQTTVAGIKTALKTAWKTGKGLKKLKQMANNAGIELDAKVNPGMYEGIILTDSAREQVLSKISSSQEKRYYEAALSALDKLVKSKGSKQTVGGYAFDIARSFNGMNANDLLAMYDAQNETLDEAEVKQSNPLVVLDKLADRSDNNAFPVKFYDGSLIKVTPKKAKKFMDVYYRMADDQRDIINKYIKTKKGFMQAITDFNIPL